MTYAQILNEADRRMEADGIPSLMRAGAMLAYVEKIATELAAAPAPDAAALFGDTVAAVGATAPAAPAAPVAAPRPDPWVNALGAINGNTAAPAAPVVTPAAPACGEVWAKALAKVNATVRGA